MKKASQEQSPVSASSHQGRSESHAVRMSEVEGKIASLDRSGNKLMLEDGTQLTIPASVKVRRDALKPGVTVNATYEEKGAEKVVISIQIWPEHILE